MSDGARRFTAVVLGSSAGGLAAMAEILRGLERSFPLPLVWVQHVPANFGVNLARIMTRPDGIEAVEAEDKAPIRPGRLYVAPPDYHLLLERDLTLSLSIDEPKMWSRPSIDLLFESAAWSCGASVIGVLLTGANSDGTDGVAEIKRCGGVTIAQDPATAEIEMMPRSAIVSGHVDHIVPLTEIARLLNDLVSSGSLAAESEPRSQELGGAHGPIQNPAGG